MDMINFLTDIYGEKVYDASTIARGVELILNPAVSVLMCETPEWFIRNIKTEILTGGIVRRFVLVYEKDDSEPIPIPVITDEAEEAKNRFLKRLVEAGTIVGEYKWGDARTLYDKWYRDNHARRVKEPSGAMRGYLKSKHIQAFKVMMLLDCASDKPMLLFTKELFDLALALLNSPEQNMPRLFAAAGRNELMPGQIRILEELERRGGMHSFKLLAKEAEVELTGLEISNVFRHLEDTGQIIKRQMEIKNEEGVLVRRWMVLTPQKYNEMLVRGDIKEGK